jgi:cobalt-zinc-cadmium efflux system membrane fusion protein
MTSFFPAKVLQLRAHILQLFEIEKQTETLGADALTLATRPRALQIRVLAAAGAAIIVLILGFTGIAFIKSRSESQATHEAPNPPGSFHPTATQLRALTIKPVEALSFQAHEIADGNIAVDEDISTPVFSPYSGRVTRLVANLGEQVQKGAPLLLVESPEFVQAQNDLMTTHAQFVLAEANEQRQRDLYAAKGAALRDWQQSQADLEVARTNEAAARNRLRILGSSDAEITHMEAASARPMGAETAIFSPIAGRVLQRQVSPGQYIQVNASAPLYVVGDLSRVWLVANIPEVDAAVMRVGEAVEVHVPAYPKRIFRATLSYVAPTIDPVAHRLAVRADVENPDGALKPQMFATFTIYTDSAGTAPGVPQGAVIYEGEHARVWVADGDGNLTLRPIRIGRSDGDMVEVADGLSVGERVVTSGSLFIDRAAQND